MWVGVSVGCVWGLGRNKRHETVLYSIRVGLHRTHPLLYLTCGTLGGSQLQQQDQDAGRVRHVAEEPEDVHRACCSAFRASLPSANLVYGTLGGREGSEAFGTAGTNPLHSQPRSNQARRSPLPSLGRHNRALTPLCPRPKTLSAPVCLKLPEAPIAALRSAELRGVHERLLRCFLDSTYVLESNNKGLFTHTRPIKEGRSFCVAYWSGRMASLASFSRMGARVASTAARTAPRTAMQVCDFALCKRFLSLASSCEKERTCITEGSSSWCVCVCVVSIFWGVTHVGHVGAGHIVPMTKRWCCAMQS